MDHAARRARLIERLRDLDVDGLFVNRLPNVRYLTGFSGSNGQLLITPQRARFLTDGRYTEQSRREVGDLERVTYGDGLPATFAESCRDLGMTRVGFEAAGVSYEHYEDLSGNGVELVPTRGLVEELRWTKDDEELAQVRAAQAVTDAAFDSILPALAEGVTERQAAVELEAAMRRAGADGFAFDTIVAFGPSAAEPHHEPIDRPLARGDVVKMDFGALVGGYHADMTRTVAFGEPSGQMREVYELVRAAQQAGVDAVHAGATGGEVDEAARSVIREAGRGDEFKHSLGHGVGLEIHEPPWLRRGGEDVLPAGTVVTVEPGVYVDGVGGVRIEDMVEVTADGCRVMPRAPKELIVL